VAQSGGRDKAEQFSHEQMWQKTPEKAVPMLHFVPDVKHASSTNLRPIRRQLQ
jgi:hypothetical protein